MKQITCFYYWLVEHAINGFIDTSEKQPAFEIPIETDWGEYKFSLFVSKNNIPEYGRLSINNLNEEIIPNEILPIIQMVKEHFLSILRTTYNGEVTLFPFPFWTFVKNISSYSFGLEIQKFSKDYFDIERAKRLFIGSFNHHDELRLFIDGYDKRIPLQYRYLSMYKIIELHYKKQGEWLINELEIFLQNYESRFLELNIQMKPKNYIALIRDKCAHIKTGRRPEVIGVTQLNHEEALKVNEIIPIMSDICIDILNTRANGDYVVGKKTIGQAPRLLSPSESVEPKV